MAHNGNPGGSLTHRQQLAIAALLTEAEVKTAAKKAGVGERTIHRWLAEDDTFRDALAAAEGDAVATAARTMAGGAAAAVKALVDVLNNPDTDDRVRIAAAAAYLNHLPKVRLLGSIEQQLAELEKAQNGNT